MRLKIQKKWLIIILFVVISVIAGYNIERVHNCGFVIETASDKEMDEYDSIDSSIIDGKININVASEEELTTINGIGEKTAQKIIEYREENGGFEYIDDIMNIKGIGNSLFNKIKEDICAQ